MHTGQALRWDVFCRLVDNLGDVGVCWRLATCLADMGDTVRLYIDDASALAWMAPQGHPRVQVLDWHEAQNGRIAHPAADVVVEAFGCELPPAQLLHMTQRAKPPVWINLEYLSAQAYVERSHGLPSPQQNGLAKWFFFPGFTPKTGGLLREQNLASRRDAFDRERYLAQLGVPQLAGTPLVSLFCYDSAGLPMHELLADLATQRACVLLPPGQPAAAVAASVPELRQALTREPNARVVLQRPAAPYDGLQLFTLPWLTQTDFDHLLWSCDFNFVRGEDSLVRALWAGAPFVWQAYVQDDGAHLHKVQALLDRLQLQGSSQATAEMLHMRQIWQCWNGVPGARWPGLPPLLRPGRDAQPWSAALAQLWAQPALAKTLRDFALARTA
jgi:uncharacterized repeat protein (TIGR03837 family)